MTTIKSDYFTVRDMTEIYYHVSAYALPRKIEAPQIIVVPSEFLDGNRYCVAESPKPNQERRIVVSEEMADNEIIDAVINEIENPADFARVSNDHFDTLFISDCYYFASAIGSYLNIQVPQIIITDGGMLHSGYARFEPGPDTEACYCMYIYLKKGYDPFVLLKTLAHELRHVWQHQYKPEEFFSKGYDDPEETDYITYNLQLKEIDAEAFARRTITDVFGLPMELWDGTYIVDRAVKHAAGKMRKVKIPEDKILYRKKRRNLFSRFFGA